MKSVICAIKDRAIDAFQAPFAVRAEGEAIRAFTDAINNQNHQNNMHAHAEDYDLYVVGHFHDHNGKIEPLEEPRQIAIGKNVKLISMTVGR